MNDIQNNPNGEGVEPTATSTEANSFTLDDVKTFLESNEDAKKFLSSEKDKHFSRSLETWKQNNLSSLVEEEVKKRYPEETEEQRKLRELQLQFDQLKQEKQIESVRNQAYKEATEKGLPLALLDFFVGTDAETTTNNLATLEKVWKEALQTAVGKTFKANGREPHKGTQTSTNTVNPWKKETFNLTMQGKILEENPELAKTLMAQAK